MIASYCQPESLGCQAKTVPMHRLSIFSPYTCLCVTRRQMMNSRDPARMIRLRFRFFVGTIYIADPDYSVEAYF